MSAEPRKSERIGKLNPRYYSSEFDTEYSPHSEKYSDSENTSENMALSNKDSDLPMYPDISDIDFPEGVHYMQKNRFIGDNEYRVVSNIEFRRDYGVMGQAIKEYKTLHHPNAEIVETKEGMQMSLLLDKLQVVVYIYPNGYVVVQDSEYGEATIRWVLEEYRKLDIIYASVEKLQGKSLPGKSLPSDNKIVPSISQPRGLRCTCDTDLKDLLCTCNADQLLVSANSPSTQTYLKQVHDEDITENGESAENINTQVNSKPMSRQQVESDDAEPPVTGVDMEFLAHVIDVNSKAQSENHEVAMTAIMDSRTILSSRLDNLASQISSEDRKSKLDNLKDNIRDLEAKNKELQAKLASTKGMPIELQKAKESLHNKDLTINSLGKELENARKVWDLERQLLQKEVENAVSQRDILEELVNQLKDRIKELNSIGEKDGTQYARDNQEETKQRPEYPVKFTAGLNPILSAFCPLDPPLIWKKEPFKSAEAAFQVEKVSHAFCELTDDEKEAIKTEIMEQENAVDAKRIGDTKIPNTPEWERDEAKVMENIQKAKRDQFPQFRDELDKTVDGVITHPVKDAKWSKLFPQILERVRDGTCGTPFSPQDEKQSWKRVWGNHRTGLVGDSLIDRIDPSTFGKDTGKVSCYTCETFLEFAHECQENRRAEVVISAVGINNFKFCSDPVKVADKVIEGLDLLRDKCPNAKICYSQMILRSTSKLADFVKAANELIEAHCKDKYYVYIKHDKLWQSPNMFTNELRSGDIDEFHPTGMGLYIANLKRVLPPRSRSPSPAPYRRQTDRTQFNQHGRQEDRNHYNNFGQGPPRGGNFGRYQGRGRARARGNPGNRGSERSTRGYSQ